MKQLTIENWIKKARDLQNVVVRRNNIFVRVNMKQGNDMRK